MMNDVCMDGAFRNMVWSMEQLPEIETSMGILRGRSDLWHCTTIYGLNWNPKRPLSIMTGKS